MTIRIDDDTIERLLWALPRADHAALASLTGLPPMDVKDALCALLDVLDDAQRMDKAAHDDIFII